MCEPESAGGGPSLLQAAGVLCGLLVAAVVLRFAGSIGAAALAVEAVVAAGMVTLARLRHRPARSHYGERITAHAELAGPPRALAAPAPVVYEITEVKEAVR